MRISTGLNNCGHGTAGSGRGLLLLVLSLALLTGCQNRAWQAHVHNERGLRHLEQKQYEEARKAFEKCVTLEYRSEIPVFNLGNTYFAQDDYSQAHIMFEKALLLDPEMSQAFYNDGFTFYRWGQTYIHIADENEQDVDWCQLASNLATACELWEQALTRMKRTTVTAGAESDLGRRAGENADRIGEQLARLRKLKEEYERRCREQARSSESASGAESASPGSGGAPSGTGQFSGSASEPGPAPLETGEREQIEQALDRLKNRASSGQRSFRQSAAQQFRRGESERYQGRIIWW